MNLMGNILRIAKEITVAKGWGARVELAELRPRIDAEYPGIEREDVDYCLEELMLQGSIVLMHMDDPHERRGHEWAELDLSGMKRHLLYVKEY